MNEYPFGHAHGYDKLEYFEFPNLEAPTRKSSLLSGWAFQLPQVEVNEHIIESCV